MQAVERKAQVATLLAQRHWSALRQQCAQWPPPETADLLFQLEKGERILVFRAMPRELAAEVFTHLEPQNRDALLRAVPDFIESLSGRSWFAGERFQSLLSPLKGEPPSWLVELVRQLEILEAAFEASRCLLDRKSVV